MENSKKSQVLTLSLIATLLSITPLLSSSFRSTYLYFIINVLIVILCAEAGILSTSSSSSSSSSSSTTSSSKTSDKCIEGENKKSTASSNIVVTATNTSSSLSSRSVVENSIPEKITVCADDVNKMIKKTPSSPSIFYIESGNETEAEVEEEEQQQEVYDDEEELFVKAENFIGNFYKQLKMQREESWNRIHEFHNNGLLVN